MKKISVVLLLGLLTATTCYADSIDTIYHDRVNDIITVSGKYDKIKDENGLKIFNPKFVLKIQKKDAAGYDDVLVIDQLNGVENDGEYSFSIPVKGGKSGEYSVVINSNVFTDGALVKDFTYYNKDDVNKALGVINGSKNVDEFTTNFDAQAEILGIDMSILDAVDDKSKVYQNLFACVPFEPTAEKDAVKIIADTYKKEAVKQIIFENENAALSAEYLLKYKDELGITQSETYSVFEDFDTEDLKVLAGKIAGLKNEYTDWSDILNNAVILTKVQRSDSYGEVGELLKQYKNIIYSNDISGYYNLSNTNSVDVKLVGESYSTVTALRTAIKNELDAKNSSGGNGGGGSSSGGGMPPVTITPAPENDKPVVNEVYYTDIDNVEWASDAINYLSARGIVNGKGAGIFAPNDIITREEFVKMLVLAFDVELSENNEQIFSDVLLSAWYGKYIAAGVKTGNIKGIGDGLFGVGMPITRQDMVTLSYRFAKSAGAEFVNDGDASNMMDRNSISDYAYEAVSVFLGARIVNGMDNNKFEPLKYSTRAQAAVVIYRVLTYMNGGQV